MAFNEVFEISIKNYQGKVMKPGVVLHTELERKLPAIVLQKVDKTELIEYPNNKKCKLGVLDFILRKWFCSPFSEDGLDMVLESGEDYITSELDKQKRRLKEISCTLNDQHQLLRLIIQKMEIKTEADDVDEGVSPSSFNPIIRPQSKWKTLRVRKNLRNANAFNKSLST